jgi:hypothetical protein
MDIGEIIAPPAMHTSADPECPFCPVEKKKPFKTFPGASKNEDALRDIMANPSVLPSRQASARPKTGAAEEQKASGAKVAPNPALQHPTYGAYTYEAHHLIPGTEKVSPGSSSAKVMDGHAIEKWIVKGEKIDNDSGYSINNSDNGTWLPSPPATVKKNRANPKPATPWASEAKAKNNPAALTPNQKQEIADYAARHGQFHYGQHKVLNEEGLHYTYPKEVQDRLTELEKRVAGWSQVCLCDGEQSTPPKPPFKPTWKINEKLDLVSMWIDIDIRMMPASSWTYFISSFSMESAKRAKAPNTV